MNSTALRMEQRRARARRRALIADRRLERRRQEAEPIRPVAARA